jgi:hypothetical protein
MSPPLCDRFANPAHSRYIHCFNSLVGTSSERHLRDVSSVVYRLLWLHMVVRPEAALFESSE